MSSRRKPAAPKRPRSQKSDRSDLRAHGDFLPSRLVAVTQRRPLSRRTVSVGDGRRLPYPLPTDAGVTKRMLGNRSKGTKPEVALCASLAERGLRFRRDYQIAIKGRRPTKPDVAFVREKLAVFIDGCFWHGCPLHGRAPSKNPAYWLPKLQRNRERDRQLSRELRKAGWTVVRCWEHTTVERAAARIMAVLARLRPPGRVGTRSCR